MEEMAELTKELSKAIKSGELAERKDCMRILEEIADVELMLAQLKWWIPRGNKDVETYKKDQIKKLNKRIDKMDANHFVEDDIMARDQLENDE